MSLWTTIYGGYWPTGYTPAPVEVPAPAEPAAPAEGEQTRRQDTPVRADESWTGWGCLGTGYAPAPPGNLATYRLMDSHPTLSLARAVVCGPLIAAQPSFEVRPPPGGTYRRTPAIGDGVTSDPLDKRKEFIQSAMECLWPDLIENCCRGLSLGHYPFEQVWARRGGRWVVEKFKPLLPEAATLLVDPMGNFAGIRTVGVDNKPLDLPPIQCFNFAYDGEAGNLYGRSRHENCRLEWWEKLQAKLKGAQIDHKASGIIPIVKAPGKLTFKNEKGEDVSGIDAARLIAKNLAEGRPVFLPNFIFDTAQIPPRPTAEQAAGFAELAKVSAFIIDFFDAGNTGPASSAILDKCRYLDSELFRAWHRPEREALEGQQGTKAESEVQGDVGTQDTERTMAGMYRQINGGCIDDILVMNHGEDARGSIYAKPPPLRDVKKEAAAEAAKAIITTPQGLSVLDVTQTFKDASLPVLEGAKPVAVTVPVPNGNEPPPRGGNGDVTALARANGEGGHIERLVRMLGESD